ncbi:MAG: hypothetical protein ACI35U_05820 [Marinilabiliaceae bacterium]|nr:hypothetical protein [Bacteroidales bacterium]MDD5814652.1 hypothetical protein [Bacteroidales bacterium]
MDNRRRNNIIAMVAPKAALRQQVEKETNFQFESLCELLEGMAAEYRELLPENVLVKFERDAKHVAMFTLDADVLVFAQHTDVFQFDRDHEAWQTNYVKSDKNRAFVGVVNVYNFLSDSFKYDRDEDVGYLVARLFVNAEGAFFVEGKRQRGVGVEHFGGQKLDVDNWRRFVETAIKYVAEFDLLVPPYDAVKLTDLAHLKQAILTSKTKTAKRMGFSFNSDDVK